MKILACPSDRRVFGAVDAVVGVFHQQLTWLIIPAIVVFTCNLRQYIKAKKYAAANNISLSRLIEFLLKKITTSNYHSLEDYPIADWVSQVAEGEAEYKTKAKTRKSSKAAYFNSRK